MTEIKQRTPVHIWIGSKFGKVMAIQTCTSTLILKKLHFIASNKITLYHDFVKAYQSGIKQTETLFGYYLVK
jgi:hypothetical protein